MLHLDDDVTIATRTEPHKKGWRSDVDNNGHGFNIMITIMITKIDYHELDIIAVDTIMNTR